MSDEEAIDQLFATFLAAMQAGDANACADAYAEEAEYIAPGMDPVKGRAAIRSLFAEIFEAGVAEWGLVAEPAVVSGDLAYSRQVVTADGATSHCMLVLARTSAGWKVIGEAEVPER